MANDKLVFRPWGEGQSLGWIQGTQVTDEVEGAPRITLELGLSLYAVSNSMLEVARKVRLIAFHVYYGLET